MPEFFYHALDTNGQAVDGILTADSESQLDSKLEQLGYWVIDVEEKKHKKDKFAVKVPRKELIDFFTGLHTMIASGITLSDGLASIAEETEDEGFARVIRDLQIQVESGRSIDLAMSTHPKIFDKQITNLIKAGEYSGNLETVCQDISLHIEWIDKILADVKQASIYPIMVLFAVLGLVFLMFAFVVPRFSKIFESLNLELPALTRAVIDIGQFSSQNWWLLLMLPVAVVAFFKFVPKRFVAVAYKIDQIKINLPIFGKLNRMIVLSRFCHNLSLLTKAGVTILDALALCKGLVGNKIMEKAVADAELFVNEGKPMTEALRQHKIVSPMVLRMLVVGEQSGNLDSTLAHASDRYDKEIPRQIQRVFSVLEPLIMLVLIVIVGLIGGAVFMPLFSVMSGIN